MKDSSFFQKFLEYIGILSLIVLARVVCGRRFFFVNAVVEVIA